MNTILGKKLSQTQMFTEDGKRIPVTFVSAGPCWVTQVAKTDTYQNVQIGFEVAKHLNKPQSGHIQKTGLTTKLRFLRSIRLKDAQDLGDLKVGSEIKLGDVFAPGDHIRVTGTSKGKGFAGVVKRHQFKGGPRTHGQSDRERAPGSIGQTTTPGRVYRGKRMAGRMGTDRVTVRNLRVIAIDAEKHILTLKGLVPGGTNGLLLIQKET